MPRPRKAAAPVHIHKVHPQLQHLLVPLTSLVKDPDNARSHDARNLKTIAASLEDHGQRKPLVVRKANNTVEAGNGTLEAMEMLGWTHCAALMCDDDEVEAAKYAVRDNRTGDLSDWDIAALAAQFTELQAAEVDLGSLGFEAFEVAPILAFKEGYGSDGSSDGDVLLPEQRVGLYFTREQWDRLGQLLACKPNADEVLKRLEG